MSFPKTTDLSCFPFRAAVFIRLKSLSAARFKLCIHEVLYSQYARVRGASVRACVSACVRALGIDSTDKRLRIINTCY